MVFNNHRQERIKFDMRGVRVNAEEIIFYTGLILWLAQFYLSRTIFLDFYGGRLLTAVRYFCMFLFAVKIFLSEKTLRIRSAAVFLIVAAVFVVVQRNVNTGMPLIQVLLMIYAARDVPFRRICMVSLWACVVLWTVPVLVDKLGIFQMERDVYKQRVREFLNYNYVSYASIYFNNILFCAMYVYTEPRRKGRGGNYASQKTASWPLIILLAAVSWWLLEVTDTTFPFYVGILFIALYIIAVKARVPLFRNNPFNRAAAMLLYPALSFFIYIFAKNYNWKISWMKKLDDMSHNRISLGFLGIRDYGVHLFGSQIKENTDKTQGRYFYIDSGFLKNLLNYGLIVFIIIILYYTIILYAAVLEHDTVLVIWLICIALYSVFNNLLLSVSENAPILAIWYALDLLKWHRHKKQYKRIDKRDQIERAA